MRLAFMAVGIGILVALGITGTAQAAITIGPATVTSTAESGSLTFTVTRDAAIGADATVKVSTAGGSATSGQDFTPVSRTVTLGAGIISPTTATVVVPILSDALDEADETFTIALSEVSQNESIAAPGTATGVITDDDPSPTVSVAPAAVVEGTGGTTTLAVPVTLSAVSGRAVSVAYATSDATAIAPGDYTAVSRTVTIPAGQSGGTAAVPVVPDALDEDDETLTVTLSTATNATLATAKATATITDDDTATVGVTGATVLEGPAGTTTMTQAIVSLTTASTRAVMVSYATANGSAVAPGDYLAASGRVSIPAGERTVAIPLSIVGDAAVEPDEALSVNLSDPSGTAITPGAESAAIIIRNDDAGTGAGAGAGTGAIVVPPNQLGTVVTAPGLTDALPGLGVTTRKGVGLGSLMFARTTGRMRFTVSCPVGAGRCKGSVTVFSVPARRSKVKALRREQQLASKRFDVAQGAKDTVTLRLSSRGRGWLRSARAVKITAYAVSRDARGASSTAKVAGTLRR